MTLFIRLLLLVVLLTPLGASAFNAFHPEAAEKLEAENLWMEVNFSGDTAVSDFRVWYPYPAEKLFLLLADTNAMPKVHPSYAKTQTLSAASFAQILAANPQTAEDAEKIMAASAQPSSFAARHKGSSWEDCVYLNINLPWPLANRWMVQKVRVTEGDGREFFFRYEYEMKAGNFKKLSGYWELVPVPGKDGWTEFRGRYKSDPGIPVPKFVARKAAAAGLTKDVEENRKALAKGL